MIYDKNNPSPKGTGEGICESCEELTHWDDAVWESRIALKSSYPYIPLPSEPEVWDWYSGCCGEEILDRDTALHRIDPADDPDFWIKHED